MISNDPVVKPNQTRSRGQQRVKQPLQDENPISSPRSIDKIDELSAALSNISQPFCR
jgi:hypothetical protein